MTIKNILQSVVSLLGAAAVFFIAFFYLNEVFVDLEQLSPFLDAPKIIMEEDFAGNDNRIVWLSGSLVPREEGRSLIAPLSKKKCLYYHYEIFRELRTMDADGSYGPSWQQDESGAEAVDMFLLTGRHKIRIQADNLVNSLIDYDMQMNKRIEISTDLHEEIDEINFWSREFIIPLENTVTVIGKLENGEIMQTDRRIIISLSSFDDVVPEFKGDIVIRLFFVIMGFITGAGLFVLFVACLFFWKNLFPSKSDIVFFFGALIYIWILTGGMMVSIASVIIIDKILSIVIVGALSGFLILFPLISHACHDKLSPFALLFIPSIGLIVLGSFFYFKAFFTVENWILPLCIAIFLSLGAVSIMVFCRWITGRKTAVVR